MVEAWERFQNWMTTQPASAPVGTQRAGDARAPKGDARSGSGPRSGDQQRRETARGTEARQQGRRATVSGAEPGSPGRQNAQAVAGKALAGDPSTVRVADAAAAPPGLKILPRNTPLPPAATPPAGTYAANEVVAVGLASDAITALTARGYVAHRFTDDSEAVVLTVPPGIDVREAVDDVRKLAPQSAAGFNRIYRPFRAQAGLAVNAPRALSPVGIGDCPPSRCFGPQAVGWRPEVMECARSVRIGLLDTAVDRTHPAFAGHALKAGDFHRQGKPAANWHGTGVLALLAGDPKSGTPGLVPGGDFYIADVFYADPNGEPATDTASLVHALEWMDKLDVKVVNMSLAGPADDVMEDVIKGLTTRGVIIVAAAGNEGPVGPRLYPAAYADVIAVTAIDRDNRSYRYANRGDYIDVAAPGVDVWTAVPGGQGGLHSGTSFAAPFVTAAVAAAYADAPQKIKATLLKALPMRDLGPPGRDPVYGDGLLQAPATCHGMPPTTWQTVAEPALPDTGSAAPIDAAAGPVSIPAASAPAVLPTSFALTGAQ